jgi:hypothetical protein
MVAWSSLATLSPSTQYSGSIFVKGSAGESIRFYLRRAFGGAMANSPFLNVVLTGSWQSVEIGSMTTASDNNNGRVFIFQASSGTPADEVYLWGAQLEAGSVSTSVIPTSGGDAAARTRAADDLEITGSAFTDFFSSSEGTFYAEYQFNDADGANSLIYGSADNQRFAYKNLGSSSPLLSYDGVNVLNYGRLAAGTLLRTALSFDSNTMEGSQDGSAATMSNQTAPFPHTGNFLTASKLHIGSDTNGGKQLNGHIKRLLFWPYHSDSL